MFQRTVSVIVGLLVFLGSVSGQVPAGTAPSPQAAMARVYRTVDGAGLKPFVFMPRRESQPLSIQHSQTALMFGSPPCHARMPWT